MAIGYALLGTSCYDYFFLGIHGITRRYDSASTYAQQMRWLKTAKENSDQEASLQKQPTSKPRRIQSNHFDIINDPTLNKFEK